MHSIVRITGRHEAPPIQTRTRSKLTMRFDVIARPAKMAPVPLVDVINAADEVAAGPDREVAAAGDGNGPGLG